MGQARLRAGGRAGQDYLILTGELSGYSVCNFVKKTQTINRGKFLANCLIYKFI